MLFVHSILALLGAWALIAMGIGTVLQDPALLSKALRIALSLVGADALPGMNVPP